MKLRGHFIRRDGISTTVYYTAVRLWPAVFLQHEPLLVPPVRMSAWRDRVTGKRNNVITIYWRWPWDYGGGTHFGGRP